MVLGSATVMVIGLVGPASAAEKTVVDVRGDAVARLDVTKVQFRHNDNGAHAKVRMRAISATRVSSSSRSPTGATT